MNGYNFLHMGQTQLIKSSAVIFAEEIEPLFKTEEWEYQSTEKREELELLGPTMAAWSELTYWGVGILIFLSSWTGNKILDELYESKLKPQFKKFLEKLAKKEKRINGKTIEYRSILCYNNPKITIIVRLRENSTDNLIKNFSLINEVHHKAVEWVKNNGINAPIHEYLIEQGKYNNSPNLFHCLGEIQIKEISRQHIEE